VRVGVLALQGDFREHAHSLALCGVTPLLVRRPEEIAQIDALVLPGGESTTIAHLARTFHLFDLIVQRIHEGMPTYGSCAGMILLADRILDGIEGQQTFGGLDITVRRNAFGRQVDSFESQLSFDGHELEAVFIRAPWVEKIGEGIEVLSSVTVDSVSHPVAVRNEHLLATSFHPELTADPIVHRYFLDSMVR